MPIGNIQGMGNFDRGLFKPGLVNQLYICQLIDYLQFTVTQKQLID
jgi:hypothetical protein